MNRVAILAALLVGALFVPDPAHAKCTSIIVRVQGNVVGQIQEGDELLLTFKYSSKRIETSWPQPVKSTPFVLEGAYSTFKRRGVIYADVCGATPRKIQLVMRDRNGQVLDTVDLTTPDEGTRSEVHFGKKHAVVVHRDTPLRS